MNPDRLYRSLLALFGFAFACTLASASRSLAVILLPWWVACCQTMRMAMGDDKGYWLTGLAPAAFMAFLMIGFGTLAARLWKTHRFVAGLKVTGMANPPTRLAQVVTELRLSRPIIVLATEIPLAFCFGLIRPRICLSTGLVETLNNQELKAVLLHEDHHRRHFDPLRGLLAEVFAAMLFFLPIAAELRDWFLTTTELEADRHAVRLAGRPSLAGALHKLLTHPRAMHLSVPGIAGLSATETRIAELLGDRPATTHFSARSLLTSSFIIMLGCMLVL